MCPVIGGLGLLISAWKVFGEGGVVSGLGAELEWDGKGGMEWIGWGGRACKRVYWVDILKG